MREIKFRAWSELDSMMYDCDMENDIQTYFSNSDGITLMQYTGLKDKNGEKIFEGDILNRNAVIFSGTRQERIDAKNDIVCTHDVRWDSEELTYTINNDNLGTYNGWNCLKVIGNIYENKELLNNE